MDRQDNALYACLLDMGSRCDTRKQACALVQLVGGAARVLHDQFAVQVMRLGRAAQQERPHLRDGLLPRLLVAHTTASRSAPRKATQLSIRQVVHC